MFARGTVGAVTVELMTIGLRAGRLPPSIPADVNLILVAGLGGGLDPTLRVGDVVTGNAIYTSAEAVLTPERKADLFRQTRARVVDMETAIVRRWAESAGVPVVAIRAVSDAADEAIDPEALDLVDAVGRPRALPVASYLVRHPLRIRRLMRLGAASRLAGDRLGKAVREQVSKVGATFMSPSDDFAKRTRAT